MTVGICLALIVGLSAAVALAAGKGDKGTKSKAKLPAAAKGFAGMVEGKVVAVKKAKIVIEIQKIGKVWKHSKAEDPESLVGIEAVVVCRKEEDKPAERQLKFLATLAPGDITELDVANRKGKTLTLLELTQEQRDKID